MITSLYLKESSYKFHNSVPLSKPNLWKKLQTIDSSFYKLNPCFVFPANEEMKRSHKGVMGFGASFCTMLSTQEKEEEAAKLSALCWPFKSYFIFVLCVCGLVRKSTFVKQHLELFTGRFAQQQSVAFNPVLTVLTGLAYISYDNTDRVSLLLQLEWSILNALKSLKLLFRVWFCMHALN